MSQRRAVVGASAKESVKSGEEMVPFSQALEKQPRIPMSMDRDSELLAAEPIAATANPTLSLDQRYEAESQILKQKLWKESPFAVGLTEPTWAEEYAKYKRNPRKACMDSTDEAGIPCTCCSAFFCSMIGAGRVGNMAILKQSTEWVEEVDEDGTDGDPKIRRFTRPRLDIVVGPVSCTTELLGISSLLMSHSAVFYSSFQYWPMLACVTYPLIFGLSWVTLLYAIPGKHPLIQLLWAICTLGLIFALALTAFRDPGILPKYEKAPPHEDSGWRWSDSAQSFRPRGAYFDPDTAVVVDGFDHT